ncbi:hypothetical protein [Lichenibacterium dinghuense]|uniref:hypothetical protein n=1 Tax=Lichenibacterium dinghuense TaxID=2895977 RepID=UPI001F1C9B79|nr:hypothetical protein [Lichenibacterium sp. 6Y81]
MPEPILIDADVALKAACYDLGAETVAATRADGLPPAILDVCRFVVRGRLRRRGTVGDPARAAASFERMLRAMSLVEPDDAQLAAAADLEAEATRLDLELDAGESQLLAILASRGGRALVTGDKRAIRAMAVVGRPHAEGRVVCLEQLMSHLVRVAGAATIRPHVCAEPAVDRSLTSCFGCSSAHVDGGEILEALASYVRHLDHEAPGVLLPGGDLAAVPA